MVLVIVVVAVLLGERGSGVAGSGGGSGGSGKTGDVINSKVPNPFIMMRQDNHTRAKSRQP